MKEVTPKGGLENSSERKKRSKFRQKFANNGNHSHEQRVVRLNVWL